jgi:hypothetical protein
MKDWYSSPLRCSLRYIPEPNVIAPIANTIIGCTCAEELSSRTLEVMMASPPGRNSDSVKAMQWNSYIIFLAENDMEEVG